MSLNDGKSLKHIQLPETFRRQQRQDYDNVNKCPVCNNWGVVQKNVSFGHPDFSKSFPCPKCSTYYNRHREAYNRLSHLANHAEKTFANFTLQDNSKKGITSADLSIVDLVLQQYLASTQKTWLVISGPPGVGKTHLAAAVANLYQAARINTVFITVPDLLDRLRAAMNPETKANYEKEHEMLCEVELLVLDDLGAESQTAWAQEKIFQILNHRYSRRLDTIVTTNLTLERLDERIKSRLQDHELCEILNLDFPDYRRRHIHKANSLTIDELLDLSAHMDQTFETLQLNWQGIRNLAEVVFTVQNFVKNGEGWFNLIAPAHGLGRTHIAAAAAHEWYVTQNQNVIFCKVHAMLDYLRSSFSGPNAQKNVNSEEKNLYEERLNNLMEVDVMILEDFRISERLAKWSREKLLEILDYRYTKRKTTFLTMYQEDLEDLARQSDRLYTRLLDTRIVTSITLQNVRPPTTADPYGVSAPGWDGVAY